LYHLWITLHIHYDPLINRITHNPFPICYYRKCLRPPTSFSAFPRTPIFGLATSFPSGSFPVRYPISTSPCIGFHYPPCRRTLSFMIVFCRVFGFGFPLTMARLGSCLHSGWHLFLRFTSNLPSFSISDSSSAFFAMSAFLHIFGSLPIRCIIRVFCNVHVFSYFQISTYPMHHPRFCISSDLSLCDPPSVPISDSSAFFAISAFLHIFGSVPIRSIIRVFCNIRVFAYLRISPYVIHHLFPFPTHPRFLQCPRFWISLDLYLSDPSSAFFATFAFLHIFGSLPIRSNIRIFCNVRIFHIFGSLPM